MNRTCDRDWQVDAYREGRLGPAHAEAFERHRAACARCAERFDADERTRKLALALPLPALDELAVRRIRHRVLQGAAVERPFSPRATRNLVVAACVVVASLVVVFLSREPERDLRATVAAEAGATWSKRTEGDVSTIVLVDGVLTIQVDHRSPRERFLVLLPDGELEVRGTRFRVAVEAGHTRSVDVYEGTVALRPRASSEVLLGASAHWEPSAPTPPAPPAPPSPSPTPATPPPSTSEPVSPNRPKDVAATPTRSAAHREPASDAQQRAYDDAIAALERGDYEISARRMRAFVATHPLAPEAEDAAFLEASALARAGRLDAAGIVAERFLEHHPASIHAAEAATLAARAAVARGACDRARDFGERYRLPGKDPSLRCPP